MAGRLPGAVLEAVGGSLGPSESGTGVLGLSRPWATAEAGVTSPASLVRSAAAAAEGGASPFSREIVNQTVFESDMLATPHSSVMDSRMLRPLPDRSDTAGESWTGVPGP
ncbi:MAG TPA: hypothetical protein VMM60_14405 [Ilumatobacter sp.]|nr:hypothetical protein [Ilumatobacter sp.]